MKKLLCQIVLVGSLWSGFAFAADNGLQVTNGSGPTLRSVDVGAGVQAVGHALVDATGGQLGIVGSPLYIRAASGFFASGAFASGSYASGAFAAGSMVDLLTMRGTVGAGTAAANSLLTGCIYNSSPITLTTGQGAAVQCSVNGYPTVVVSNTLTALTPGDGITTGTYASGSPVLGASLLWNGTTYDRWKSAGVTGVAAVRQSDGTNVAQLDPCQSEVKSTLPITLATAAVKVIAVGVSAKKIYVCQLYLNNNAADSVAIFEATTATTCATSPIAVVGAGTSVATAATGNNWAANGGLSQGNGAAQVLATTVNNNDLCVAQSAATQLTGSITYVTR